MIGYMSKGGVTYGDTEQMTPHERHITLNALKEILEEQAKATKEASKGFQPLDNRNDPKSRLTSGIGM